MTPRSKLLALATALLLVAGAARILVVVLHQPLLGYANNGDFARVGGWFGLWPELDGIDPRVSFPSAPVELWRIDPRVVAPSDYLTTELAVVGSWLALPEWAHAGAEASRVGALELRRLGLWRALWLVAGGLFVTVTLRRISPLTGLVAAAIFAVVLCDPMTTLYFNTLYSEFSLALVTFVTVALALFVIAVGPDRPLAGGALALALFALGWTKIQFYLLPAVLAAIVVAVASTLHRPALRSPVALAVFFLLVTASVGAAVMQQRRTNLSGGYMAAYRMCSTTDAYFGTFLALLADPAAGVKALGLPERCAAYVGKTWFDPGMDPPPCPELFDVPRVAGMLRLELLEPAFLPRLIAGSLPLTRPFVHSHLGQIAGEDHRQAALTGSLVSISTIFDRLPFGAFVATLILALLGWLAALFELACSARRPGSVRDRLLPALVLLVGAVVIYTFVSSIVGDGYSSVPKHFFLGQLGLTILVPASALELGRVAVLAARKRGADVVE